MIDDPVGAMTDLSVSLARLLARVSLRYPASA